MIARAAGQTAGPPLAVKRLAPTLPATFSIGAADSMMGQALPAKLRLEARLDTDGDPLTRPPTDPTGMVDDVALGSTGVQLVLKAK